MDLPNFQAQAISDTQQERTSLSILQATLDLPLRFDQIPHLRGALVDAAGREFDLLHNHKEGEKKFHFRLPLVQYRSFKGKAMLIGLNEGAETLREVLFTCRQLRMQGEEYPVRLHRLEERSYDLGISKQMKYYRIHQWVALNQENHHRWHQMDSFTERLELLKSIFKAHVLSFAAGVDWNIGEQIEVDIVDFIKYRPVRFHNVQPLAFDVVFKCNLDLAPFIGLGRGVSHGFGVLLPCRQKK